MKRAYIGLIIILVSFLCIEFGIAQEEGVNIHGFISQGYIKSTGNNWVQDSMDGTFQFNEMGINFSHQPMDKLLIGIQFFARDYGSVGNDDITLDWAFADYRLKDYLGIRAGKIKNPYGFYGETRDIDMLRTPILLPDGVYHENFRETTNALQGVGIYGDINMVSTGTISYQFLIGTNNVVSDGGVALFLSGGMFDIYNIELDTTFTSAISWAEPFGFARIGATAIYSDLYADAITTDGFILGSGYDVVFSVKGLKMYIFSFEFTWESLVFAYEYFLADSTTFVTLGTQQITEKESNLLGAYGMFTYRINDFFEFGYSYGEYYHDKNDRDGSERQNIDLPQKRGWHKENAFSLRCDLNSNWILKIEARYIDGAAKAMKSVNLDKQLDDWEQYWWIYAAKVSYNF